MEILGGILVIIAIVAAAGAIAYVGDRVGHQVGRRRLTLWGLRPKHTSTIVAVGTGMGIALFVTLLALLVSSNVQAAFFHIAALNSRVNELQAQADELQKQTHDTNVVINRGQLMYGQALLIRPQMPTDEKAKDLADFFDAAVRDMNTKLVPDGLKPKNERATDPEIAKTLDKLLGNPDVIAFLSRGPIVILVLADQNLFANDPIHFSLTAYPDQRVFVKDQVLLSETLVGGTTINPQIVYGEAVRRVPDVAIEAGMPYALTPYTSYDLTFENVQKMADTIHDTKGTWYLQVRAASDIYPHLGGIPVYFQLSRTPR